MELAEVVATVAELGAIAEAKQRVERMRQEAEAEMKAELKAGMRAEVVDEKVAAMVTDSVMRRAGEYTEVILAKAEVNKQVILGHQQDAARLRQLVGNLTSEIAASAMLAQEMELLAQILAGSGAEPADENRARQVVLKALNMGQRVSSLKALSETLKNLISIEREAYNIDPKRDREPDVGDLSDDELAKKLAKYGITLPSP